MIKKNIYGKNLKKKLVSGAKDRLFHFFLKNGLIKGGFAKGTRMVNEMRANHELGILETLILGHAYLGNILMTTGLKGNDKISLRIDCSGPVKGLNVEANTFGEVKGYLKNVPIPIEKPLENFNTSAFFGAGFLTVTKHIEDAKQPYSGKIILQYGNIAQDLANYYLTSEQTPTAFNLSINFDKKGAVNGAAGLILQAMPGASNEMVNNLENLINDLPSLGKLIADGEESDDFIKSQFKKFSPEILSNDRIEFFCRCNKKRIGEMIAMLPKNELEDIIKNGPFPVETKCHNCNTIYSYNRNEIEFFYNKKINKI